jgi:hypothetical protein
MERDECIIIVKKKDLNEIVREFYMKRVDESLDDLVPILSKFGVTREQYFNGCPNCGVRLRCEYQSR